MPQVNKALPDQLESRGPRVTPVRLVCLVRPEKQDHRVLSVLPDQLAQLDRLARPDLRARAVYRGCKAL